MSGVLNRRHISDTGKAVKYTPCAKTDQTDEEELEEVAVISTSGTTLDETPVHHNTNRSCSSSRLGHDQSEGASRHGTDDDAQSAASIAANGPRALPGPGMGGLFHPMPSDRTKLIGARLSSTGKINVSSPVYSGRVVEQKSTSKQSLLDLFSSKLDRVRGRKSRSFSKEEVSYVNKAHTSDVMTPREIRKQRRKEIEEKFGKKARNASKLDRVETSTTGSDKDGCKWTFVFDPSGRLAYWWSFVVSVAFIYNFWVLIYRFAFEEINENNIAIWFTLDYFADLLYILDIAFHFRTGYLEDGVLQTDSTKLRIHYMNSTMFYIDCLCLLPLDFLYLSIGYKSMLRCFRLVKIYRFWACIDRTERHTNYPNVVRTVTLLHYLFAVYHWNACLLSLVIKHLDPKYQRKWIPAEDSDVLSKYLHSLYWSTLALTTIGDIPKPELRGEYLFIIVEFVFGLLLIATILGHVANIVTSISTARKDFQAKLDCVKTYMILRRVPLRLQDRVIKWFDYLWLSKKSSDEERTLNLLPDKLKAEIALHVHLDTLKRVEIFQNTEAGFLCELVLKLRPVLFSPSDYICRKGEVGKEMYIVNRGRLQVVADNGRTVLATLRAGSYFGEISILNMGNAGNRRTASVRSVGYSDLFCLSKNDLWEVLKDYPTARVRLEAIAVKRLEKYKKAPLEKVALPRSKSTPGMIESSGKVPLENMLICRSSLPPNMVPRSQAGSHDRSEHSIEGSEACHRRTPSSHSSRHSATGGSSTNMIAGEPNTQETGGITNSMTISSITSYVTDGSGARRSPAPHDPVRTETSPVSHMVSTGSSRAGTFTASPSASTATVGLEPFQRPTSPALFGSQQQQSVVGTTSGDPHHPHVLPVFTTLPQSHHPTPLIQPTPQLVPLPTISPAISPPQQSLSGNSQLPNVLKSHSPSGASYSGGTANSFGTYHTYPPGSVPQTANLLASSSVGSLSSSRDPQNEVLLQEITRLRERLQSLESENATMSVKLNQQQWEVENRLAEIEMHICGSDSCSGSEVGNKESVI